jgi:DnaK suppressor protein
VKTAKKAGVKPGLKTKLKTAASAQPKSQRDEQAPAAASPKPAVARQSFSEPKAPSRKATLTKFRKLFESQRKTLLFNDKVVREDFSVNADDRFDEIDQAQTDIEQSMRMRLCNREALYLKKVEEALRRIEEGSFGECEDCGEEIEFRRLEARPTATLCVGCKEEQERRENFTAAGRRHKSLGEAFSRRTA